MAAALGYLLAGVSLGRLCYLYFFLVPIFLPREDVLSQGILFGIGYLFSGTITALAVAERMCAFAETVRFRKYTPVILGLIAVCFLSVAVNTPGKLFAPMEYYFKYFKLIFPLVSFFVMVGIWTYRDLPKLYALLLAMVLVSIACMLPEALEYLANPSGTPRFGSFFKEPNKYAVFINILYGMTLPDLISSRLKGARAAFLSAVNIVLVVVIFLTQSRSGIFTWTILTCMAFWPRQARPLFKKALPFLAGAGILFVAAIILRYLNQESSANASDLGRLWTYLVGFQIVSQQPITGIGYANIITYSDQFGGVYKFLLGRGVAIHNTILEIWAETGIVGMILYLVLMFGPFRILISRIRSASRDGEYPALNLAAVSIPIAFFCFGLFYPNYLADDYFWVYMAFTFVALRHPAPRDFRFTLPRIPWV